MLEVEVTVGEVKVRAKALVDTGAQATLVKRGLLPTDLFKVSDRPLMLKTVSGEELFGGKMEVKDDCRLSGRGGGWAAKAQPVEDDGGGT